MRAVLVALTALASIAHAEPEKPARHARVGALCAIEFAPGKAALTRDAAPKLGEAAAWAHDNPEGTIVLDAYADPGARDRALSLRRAVAVKAQLVALAVESDHVVIAAHGGARHRVVITGTRESVAIVADREQASGAIVRVDPLPTVPVTAGP